MPKDIQNEEFFHHSRPVGERDLALHKSAKPKPAKPERFTREVKSISNINRLGKFRKQISELLRNAGEELPIEESPSPAIDRAEQDADADKRAAAEFIAIMSGHLSRMATDNRLDFLAYLIEMVTFEAWAAASDEEGQSIKTGSANSL